VPDPAARDPGWTNLDEVLSRPAWPWLDAHCQGMAALLLGVQMMRRTLDKHTPPFVRLYVEVVDLESDSELRVRDPCPEVFFGGAILGGPEQDGTVVQLVIDWQHSQIPPTRKDKPADAAVGDKSQALSIIQGLQHGLRHCALSHL